MTTIKNIKHVIKNRKNNDNYKPSAMRKALNIVKEYELDVRTISVDFFDEKSRVRALDSNGATISLKFRPNSDVAYILAGLGGAY
jgi:hypothetical protein